MSKVVFYNSNQVWGGGEKWHFEMAKALGHKGHDVSLITNPNSELKSKALKHGLSVNSIKTENFSFLNPFKLILLFFLLKKIKPDAIFLNLPSDVKICAPIAKLAGVKKIIYRRGMPNPIRNTFLNRFFYSKVDTIIANSEEINKTIIQNIKALSEKVIVIYNGVEPKKVELSPIHSPVRLGNLGRLVEQKGQIHLIKVAQILKNEGIKFTLEIAGKGPLESQLQALINENNLQKEVKLIGHVNADQFFQDLDIFLFTSHFEGSANALIEAHQYGVPAIAFDISSNSEVLQNNMTGHLVAPFNEKEMATKTIELINSPEFYKKFQHSSLEIIQEKFDYSQKVLEVEALLRILR